MVREDKLSSLFSAVGRTTLTDFSLRWLGPPRKGPLDQLLDASTRVGDLGPARRRDLVVAACWGHRDAWKELLGLLRVDFGRGSPW